MRGLFKIGFSLLVLAFVLIGVSYGMLRAQGVSGTANPAGRMMTSDTRTLGNGIDAVDLSGPIDLRLRYGSVPMLVVRGEQRMLGNVETSQEQNTLHIRTRGIVLRHRQPLQVELTLPALSSMNVDGSGESTISGFSGERIEVQLDGSGSVKFTGRYRQAKAALHGSGDLDIDTGNSERCEATLDGSGHMTLVGACRELKAEVMGSGALDAEHLRADDVSLKQLGSGSTTIAARKAVAVALSGSGSVEVYGNPNQRSVSRTGSGEVTFTD
jgi:hypothetical protein